MISSGHIVRYGVERINSFMKANGVKIIMRSHECVMDGIEKFGNTNLYTVFSCTDYGGQYKNKAAFLLIKKNWANIDSSWIESIPGNTTWFNLNKSKTASIGLGKKAADNDLRNRPITPPRKYIKR